MPAIVMLLYCDVTVLCLIVASLYKQYDLVIEIAINQQLTH